MTGGFRRHPAARLSGPAGPLTPEGPLAEVLALPGPMFGTLTGGTTGHPRTLRRSMASWTASFDVNAALFGLGPGRQVATLGHLSHSLTLYAAVEGLHLGMAVHLLGDLRPDRQLAALAGRGIDTLYATPSQVRLLPDGPLPDLRLVLCGGARLDPGLRARLQARAPHADIREFYGAAETSFVALSDAGTPPGAVGRPYPGVTLDLRQGEVWVRSPYLFDGYDGPPGSARRDGPWVSVGEVGRLEDGFLWLEGRRDRLIRVAETSLQPEVMEAFLETLPGIRHAAVLPRPDAARGAVPVAVLQGDAGQDSAVAAALIARFGPLLAPKERVWRADWPLLPSGKTDLRALGEGP